MSGTLELIPAELVDIALKSQRNGGARRLGYDLRVFRCPTCGGPAMNSMMGVVLGACGVVFAGEGEIDAPCQAPAQKVTRVVQL